MLRLVKDIETFKVYAIRTDSKKLPIIEDIDLYECVNKWGEKIFRPTLKIESKNELYPYDALFDRQYVKPNSISDCYSKGYIFYSKHDAIKRLELLMNKHEVKMEKAIELVATWKARLDSIKQNR